MKGGVRQGVALIFLCLASTCWTQEILEDEQNLSHPAEPQDIQESSHLTARRQPLNIRSNAARRLQTYQKRGMSQAEEENPTENERAIENGEPDSPTGSFRSWETSSLDQEGESYLPQDTTNFRRSRPNSRIGFRRRIDRFRAEASEPDFHQQSPGGEDQINLANEFPQGTELSNLGDEERGNRNTNHFTDISQNNNKDSTILSVNDAFNSYHNDNRDRNDHTLSASGDNTQLNEHIPQETSEVRSNFNEQWENQDFRPHDQQQVPENFNGNERGIVQNNIGLSSRRFRINNNQNIARKRLRIPLRRRIFRLRGPNGRSRFLQRNIRLGHHRTSQANVNRQQLNTEDEAASYNRKIDPSLLLNPNDNAQRILQLDEQNQSNSGNSVLPENLSGSEGHQESRNFSPNVPQGEDPVSTSERELSIDANQNSLRPNFLQRPSQRRQTFRTRVRRPNDVSVILSSNNDSDIPSDLNDESFQTQDLAQHSQISQSEQASFSEPRIIPVQFIANRQQQSVPRGNNQSGSGHQFSPQLSPSHFQQQDFPSSRERSNEPHNTGNQQIVSGNEYSIDNQDVAANQAQFSGPIQSSRLQPDNFQRLSQFQQQIENKRLLQYNQNRVQESPRLSQKSSLLRQQILEDQRLLQYPRQQANSQTTSQYPNPQDSTPADEVVLNNSKFTQGSEVDEEHSVDIKTEKVSHSPQYLVDQYFKPAQLTDAFGPGRKIISNRNQQRNQEGFTRNQVSSPSTLSNGNVDHQIRSQNTRLLSGLGENTREIEEFARESIKTEGRNYENTRESTDFKTQQNVVTQEFQGQSAGQSHFSIITGTATRENDEHQRDTGRGRQNVPAIPGRVEPNTAFPPRTPIPQLINRDHHDIHALDRTSGSNVNIQNSARRNLSPTGSFRQGVDTVPSQNLQFTSGVQPAVIPGEIQRNNINIARPESFIERNSQQNGYLPQYESNSQQIQNRHFSSVINDQSFDQNIEQEFGTRNKQVVRERNNQHTSGIEGRLNEFKEVISNVNQYSDSRQTNTQTFGKTDNSNHNQLTGIGHGPEIQVSTAGWRQNPFSDTRHDQSPAFNPQHTFTEQGYNQNPLSDSSFNTQNQFTNVRQHSSNVQRLPRVKPESNTPQLYLSEGKFEDNIPEEFTSIGGFHSGVPDNLRSTSQQNLDESSFHQQPISFSNRRTPFDRERPAAEENVSKQEFSNQNYLPNQNVDAQENNKFGQNVKITNAHGQPGFTYQRNFGFENFNNNDNQRPLSDHSTFVIDSRQSDQVYPTENSNSQSQIQTEHLSTHTDWESRQGSGVFTDSFQYPTSGEQGQISPERNQHSSTSRTSGRGSRKFLDTIKGVNSEVPKKDLLETIAAMLQGSDYFDKGNVSSQVQRISNKPRLTDIPETGFRCEGRVSGYYADAHRLARCRSFHFCGVDGSKISYLCPAGTVFNQRLLVCDHVFRVECSSSEDYYHVNERLYGANVHQPLRDVSRGFRSFGRRV